MVRIVARSPTVNVDGIPFAIVTIADASKHVPPENTLIAYSRHHAVSITGTVIRVTYQTPVTYIYVGDGVSTIMCYMDPDSDSDTVRDLDGGDHVTVNGFMTAAGTLNVYSISNHSPRTPAP